MIPGAVARWTMHVGEKDDPIFKANTHTRANHRWKRHEVQGKGVHLVTNSTTVIANQWVTRICH